MKAGLLLTLTYFIFYIYFLILVDAQNGKFILESAIIKCETSESEILPDDKDFTKQILQSIFMNDPIETDVVLDLDIQNPMLKICKKKIVLTLKIITDVHNQLLLKKHNSSTMGDKGALIQIGDVIDENNHTVYLVEPIAIKIQQLPVFQVYSIKYLHTVNAKASEEVYNHENTENFKGCKQSEIPNCAFKNGDKETIVNRPGFCCSCIPKNKERSGHQIRGKQWCPKNNSAHNKNMTKNVLKPQLDSSIHCLRFSKFWYGVHEIGPPQIFQEVFIHIYKRSENENGTTSWNKIGESNHTIRVDSHIQPEYTDIKLSVTYRQNSLAHLPDRLYQPYHRLLIPKLWPDYETNNNVTVGYHKIPHAMVGRIDETYLVVRKNMLDNNGRQCDKIGVTNNAFITQSPEPCRQPKGTCLDNQPLDLWALDDKEFESPKSQHEYKLKHFGSLNLLAPLKKINDVLYLVFEPEIQTTAHIDISFPADELFVMKPGYGAAILYITSDSSPSTGKLTVQVANKEIVPSYFAIKILHCTDADIIKHTTQRTVILPKDVSTFVVPIPLIENARLSHKVNCSVAVVNQHNKIIAIRDSLLSPGDTCFCKLHCQCVCSKDNNFKCERLKNEKIIIAGLEIDWFDEINDPKNTDNPSTMEFFGSDIFNDPSKHRISLFILGAIFIILVLLFLGTLKGLLGKRWKKLGRFGLGYFYNHPRPLTKYHEKEYSKIDVIHDEDGFALDPFTKLPTVEKFSEHEVFIRNILIFLIFPWLFLMWITNLCRRTSKSPFNSKKTSEEFQNVNNDENISMTKIHGTRSEPYLSHSTDSVKRYYDDRSTSSRINKVRPSDSTMEYHYRKSQDGGNEYSVNGGEWKATPRSFSISDTALPVSRGDSKHIPSFEMDLP